jgi:hypothetical protein
MISCIHFHSRGIVVSLQAPRPILTLIPHFHKSFALHLYTLTFEPFYIDSQTYLYGEGFRFISVAQFT